MTTATLARLDVVPLSKHIGAEIRGFDLREKPDEDTIDGSTRPGSTTSSSSSPTRSFRRRT